MAFKLLLKTALACIVFSFAFFLIWGKK